MVVISGIAFAVAAPILLTASRVADVKTAQSEVASAIRKASESAATGGRTETLAVLSLNVSSRIVVDPPGLQPPGAVVPDQIVFQGGTGYPYALGANRSVAVVVADINDLRRAAAVVVGRSGTVSRWHLVGEYWEVEK